MKKYNLTYPQKNIWLVEKFNENTPINLIVGTVEINEEFNELLCEEAINHVIASNDAMRLILFNDNGNPIQEVTPYLYQKFEVVDMSLYSDSQKSEYINDWILRPLFFDKCGKLFQFCILKYNDTQGAILMKVHHIIADAWSCGQIGSQLIAYMEQTEIEKNQEKRPSYLEYIQSEKEYEASEKYVKDEEFWHTYLEDIKEQISLKEKAITTSTCAKRYHTTLDQTFNDDLLQYCKENKLSPYAVFLAAITTYLYRVKDKDDFILGTPVLNRSNFREKQMLGMFVSTIPIRMKITENMSFLELSKQIASDTLRIFRHQKYPYSKTIEHIHQTTDIKDNLYNIVVSYQNAKTKIENDQKYSTTWKFVNHISDQLQIHIMDMDGTGVLNINYDYLTDVFTKEEIAYLHTRLIALMNHAINDVEVNVEDIRIMSEQEEHRILYEFNNTETIYPKDKTVIALFEEQVEKTPDAIALVFGNEKMTYRKLGQMVDELCNSLIGIENENIIVSLDNSFNLIISIYGILKSGNCYIPVNKSTPHDRVQNIIHDCQCKYAITDNKTNINLHLIQIPQYSGITLCENKSTADGLAYMIYTSGSTGVPKGVEVTNRSLTNYIYWARSVYCESEVPIMPLYSSIEFDLTVTTLFLPLICGGHIVICKNDNEEIIKIFREDRVNLVKLTPAHLSLINEASIKVNNIHTLILGGDSLKSNDAKKITIKNKKIKIFNEYGPTEATVGCMIYQYHKENRLTTVPIGKPANNHKIFVMSSKKRLMPLGVEGEIYIQGNGLARGYHNMENKTKDTFVNNPYNGKIMYKTGDRSILDFTLNMIYLGRMDKQIKINGNRIELEEIENVAKKQFQFKNVITDVKQISNIPNICLYYISDKEYNASYIRAKLNKILPRYMIPSRYMRIERIPVNKNGKVVREELPIPIKHEIVKEDIIKYNNKFEKIVCSVWEKILDLKNINPQNSIFDYGVDSLNIIRAQVKLANYTNVVNIQKFYEFPVIREFCNELNEQKQEEINIKELEDYRTIQEGHCVKLVPKKNIMLIGATGFLGIHILRELLKNDGINKIYCIVRGMDYRIRLQERFESYFDKSYEMLYNEKVIVVNGNIEQENFGLSNKEIQEMLLDIGRIINAAAIVKHHGSYSEFDLINVVAVKNIAEICIKFNLILDHISTISIGSDGKQDVFNESKFYINQNYRINPYIESKFKAELYIFQCMRDQNLMANIYRVGNLTWRYSDGVYQKQVYENGFLMRMKNIFDLKKYPTNFKDMKVEMTPVDIAADFITAIINENNNMVGEIYHIYNPNMVAFNELLTCFKKLDQGIKEVTKEEFMDCLKSYDSRENVLLNDIISSIGFIDVHNDNSITTKYLKKMQKKWPLLTKEYIVNILKYIKK